MDVFIFLASAATKDSNLKLEWPDVKLPNDWMRKNPIRSKEADPIFKQVLNLFLFEHKEKKPENEVFYNFVRNHLGHFIENWVKILFTTFETDRDKFWDLV